ncbi:MAG: hypothetical protein JNM56_31815 [Planctomycetia bacterium]|nr:hypothetical protein [Planctomycetia bacterium]
MDKQCTSCRQLLADDAARCLHCGARQAVDTSGWGEESEAEIDLGSPVRVGVGPTGPTGPPSGASFISWNALLRARKQSLGSQAALELEAVAQREAAALATPRTVPAGPAASAAPPAVAGGNSLAVVGFIAGLVTAAALWLVGLEPAEAWRQPVLRWLHGAPAAPQATPEHAP